MKKSFTKAVGLSVCSVMVLSTMVACSAPKTPTSTQQGSDTSSTAPSSVPTPVKGGSL